MNYRNWKAYIFYVFAIMLLFVPLAVYAQQTDTPQTSCISIDAVILLDQSGSMEDINDNKGFRIVATQDILRRFSINPLLECPDAYHRFGVIEVGTDANPIIFSNEQPVSPWLQLGGYGYQFDVNKLEQQISPYIQLIEAKDLDNTNTPEAIKKGLEILSLMEGTELGTLPRKQALILITDGAPYTGSASLNSLIGDAKQYLDNALHVRFWVLALNQVGSDYLTLPLDKDLCNSSDRCNISQFWSNEAELHNGEFIPLLQNLNEIPDQLNKIYDDLLGVDGRELFCDQPFYIDPYIQSATFTISKASPDIQGWLEFMGSSEEDPLVFRDGQILQGNKVVEDFQETRGQADENSKYPNIGYWANIDSVERYILSKPAPGKWKVSAINCSDPNFKVRYARLSVAANLISPSLPMAVIDEKPFYDEEDENNQIFFEVKVEDSLTHPVDNNPRFPLHVIVKYTDPDGNSVRMPDTGMDEWQLEYQGDGVWRANKNQPILVPKVGTYEVTIRGTSPSADPSLPELIIFEKQNLFLKVLDVRNFRFDIETPNKDQAPIIIPLNVYDNRLKETNKPIDVEVRLSAKELGEEILTSDEAFEARLILENENVIETIYLTEEEPFVYSGTFRKDTGTIDEEGEYKIKVQLVGKWGTKWLPVNIVDEVTIYREKVNKLNAIFENRIVQLTSFSFAALLLIGLVIYFIWMRTGPLSGLVIIYKRLGVSWDELGSIDLRSTINHRRVSIGLRRWHSRLGKLTTIPVMEIDEYENIRTKILSGINIEIYDRRKKLLVSSELFDNENEEFEIHRGENLIDEFKIEYRM